MLLVLLLLLFICLVLLGGEGPASEEGDQSVCGSE